MTTQDREAVLLPAGLRERVLQASHQARAAGQSVPEIIEISSAEAFSRAADAFHAVLCALTDSDWHQPVIRDLDVQGLVGHLIGVELDMHRCVLRDPGVAAGDHVHSTQPAAVRQAGRRPIRTRTEWRHAADHTLELVEALDDLDIEVALHGMEPKLSTLLVVRAFELWTHENDIRRVAGLPASVPDPSTLHLMTELAARLLPYSAERVGVREPTLVHLVLTGAGGGTWDLAVGAAGSDAVAIRIITDAASFCRLAANRTTPGELDLDVSGDLELAGRILAAVSNLALD